MSNVNNGADYGKMYLFLGQLKDDWMKKADANNDGEVTAGEFCWFINESTEWDTDTLGNRPDNDIIHNFFSKMLDINNTSQHYLDQAEMGKVFDQDRDGDGTRDWKQYIQKFAESIGLTLGEDFANKTLDDIEGIADDFEKHSYVKWNVNSDVYPLAYSSSGYTIRGLIKDSKNMTFAATAEDLSNVNFNNGTLTFKAPALEEDKTYTITIKATGKDGSEETKNITVKIGAKPKEVEPEATFAWKTCSTYNFTSGEQASIDHVKSKTDETKFSLYNNGGISDLKIDPITGIVTFTVPEVTEPKDYDIVINASFAAGGSNTTGFKIHVEPAEKEDETPFRYVNNSDSLGSVKSNEAAEFKFVESMPNDTEFTIINNGGITGLTIENGAFKFIAPNVDKETTFTIVVQANYGDNKSNTTGFKVTVLPAEKVEEPGVEWKSTSFSLNSGEIKNNLATVSSKTGDLNFHAESDNEKLSVATYAKTGELKLTASVVEVITPATVTVIATTPDGKEVGTKTFKVTINPLVEQEDDSNDPPFYLVNPADPFVPSGPSDTPETPTTPGLKTVEGFDVLL